MYAAALLAVLLFSYVISTVAYRLLFHPLAGFPGPRFAAATQWYEAFFDLCKAPGGTYMFEIDRMHARYGPIVRVSPHELHVKDAGWAEVLYTHPAQGLRDKYWPAAMLTGMPGGVFGTVQHTAHRERRAAISGLFSQSSVMTYEPALQRVVRQLCLNLSQACLHAQSVELGSAFLAMTTDAVYELILGRSCGLQINTDRTRDWKKTIKAIADLTPTAKQFPWLIPMALRMPHRLLDCVFPSGARLLSLYRDLVREAKAATGDGHVFEDIHVSVNPPTQNMDTIFQRCLESRRLNSEDKTPERLAQEAFTTMVAGGEAPARVLSTACFHIIANKERVLSNLTRELKTSFPDANAQLDITELQKLPYLTAVVKESLRITSLVASRIPLVAPYESLNYKHWCIPPGTPVSMSFRDILFDEGIFENPMEFQPERWHSRRRTHIQGAQGYVPFGRGSRACIGMNLAMAELYLVLGNLFRKFDLELFETTRARDIDVVRDSFIGEPCRSSRGVRVKVSLV